MSQVSPGVTQQVLVSEGQGDQPLLQPTTPEQHQGNSTEKISLEFAITLNNCSSPLIVGLGSYCLDDTNLKSEHLSATCPDKCLHFKMSSFLTVRNTRLVCKTSR